MMAFIVLFGYEAKDDMVGAFVGHTYYFIVDILPKIPEFYKLNLLKAPRWLDALCQRLRVHEYGQMMDEQAAMMAQAPWFQNEEDELRQI